MKNFISAKKIVFNIAVVTSVSFLMNSCNNNAKPEDTKEVAEEHNEAKFESKFEEKDAQFLVNTAEMDLEEILLGQLAQERGTNSSVKNLGKMMIQTHEQNLKDLTVLAGKKSITIPSSTTDKGQKAYQTLNTKMGKEFDKAYCDMIVTDHRNAISLFDKASVESKDGDVSQWATETLPELRTHLDQALTCQTECERSK